MARADGFLAMGSFRQLLAASLAISGASYFALTWRWPLVGDASLIHYIAFLIGRGWAPYRQLGDMNMPGSFLIELAAMHLYGPGALAWRLFDFTLVLAGSGAMFAICGRRRWLSAMWAGALFVLIHGRDGLAQGGQRDLTMAICLLGATALLLVGAKRSSAGWWLGFGLLSGIATTIKPTALLLTALQCAIIATCFRTSGAPRRRPITAYAGAFAVGWLLAPAACLVFVVREHALGAFLAGFRGIVPYYWSLGHRPLAYVVAHSLSPIEPLAVLWLLLLLLRGPRRYFDLRRQLLSAGVLFGFVNCIAQHRALPYYRYPLLAFLLPLIALDLTSAAGDGESAAPAPSPILSRTRRLARPLAVAVLGFGALFLAPASAVLIHGYRWNQTDMLDSLTRSLQSLGGPALSGHIQCIDSVSGCNTVLYRMRLEPATGVLSDFLLFGNTTDASPPEDIPILRETRAEFLSAITVRPPQVIVVTSHLHMTGPEDFGKLERWPALEGFLASHYSLLREWSPTRPERWWSREELPASYRIYVLRGWAGARIAGNGSR